MAVLCMAACSQTFEDVSNNVKSQEKAKGRLVMSVGSQSRTIIPDISIVESDIKTARLTANGTEIKSWNGSNIIEQIENTEDILLDVGRYDFEMTFCNENGDVFLIGTIADKEIKSGNNSLVFDMKLAQGNGNIAIGLSWEADCKISKIKAGLYDINTGNEISGYEKEEIAINTTVAGYIKESVPSGQYIIKFELYEEGDKLLNTLTDVIKVSVGKTTTEQKVLSNINTLYTITYDLVGGNWKEGFIPVTIRDINSGILLPTADTVTKNNYILSGWYDKNGNKVTQIASGAKEDATFTAKWGVTADKVEAAINALSGTSPHDITVIGAITTDTISAIKTALTNNSNKKINLDLSETTGLTSIGQYAFKGCSSLTSMTIPDSVTSIGQQAFQSCSSLESIHITDLTAWMNIKFSSSYANPLSNGAKLYLNGSLVTDLVIPDSVTSIGSSAFYSCSSLESVTIPDSVTSIGSSAFYSCSSLESVTIPDSVTSIGGAAFSGCSSLESVTIPDSVTSIGGSAFYGCSSLTSVTIPDSVTSIGGAAFSGCSSLESVTIPDSVTSIGGSAFSGCSSLESVTIPDSVTSIGYYAFEGCSSLTSVTIPDGVTTIGESAFNGCSSLTSVAIPDSVTTIGESAFSGCSSLTSVTIPDSVTSISYQAFSGCSSLESVTIPDSVTYIGGEAFSGCSSLESVTIPDSVTSIGGSAFSGCSSLESVTIPDSVTSIDNCAFDGCSSLTNLRVDTNNPNYSSSDDGKILYNKDKTKLIAYPSATGGVEIPDSVTSIDNCAFDGCSSLTSVTIPDSVTSIGGGAFSGCSSLTSVTIPDSVTTIGRSAFSGCSSLESVVIPDSVTSIGEWAFDGCSSLTTVNYKGTQEQWGQISIGYDNEELTSATINYNYTGE